MRADLKARGFLGGTMGLGLGLVVVAAVRATSTPLGTLALLAAAVAVTEHFQVASDEDSLDPLDGHTFSFSSGVHIAAVLMLGPFAAALVAAFGVLVVDRLRGEPWPKLFFNASTFALAAAAGGSAYVLLGGHPGQIEVPGDILPIVGLLVTYRVVNLGLVSGAVAVTSGARTWPVFRDALRLETSAAAAEAGLGVSIAYFAITKPWLALALVPLGFSVYQSHARLTTLRRETLRALETFANVVDERDPHTYRHSQRVAEYVRSLSQSLGLPTRETARLRLAARLHDLGKVAVGNDVLGKPSALNDAEWAVMRRHARLSARLLRRFRFAAEEARVVEYHHERFDGAGYYGIRQGQIPLGSHFLIVADSYDAMTSDRPYRDGLTTEQALEQIRAGTGSQFHPAVAKAFVALQSGLDPLAALTPAEIHELTSVKLSRPRRRRLQELRAPDPTASALGGLVVGLVIVGFGHPLLAVPAFAVALAGLAWHTLEDLRAGAFERSLRRALAAPVSREGHFHDLVGRLASSSGLTWAGLVAWRGHELGGTVELESSPGDGPSAAALVSWLIRDTETRDGLITADGHELGRHGAHVALPLLRDGVVVGYLAFAFRSALSRRVQLVLRACADDLAHALLAEGSPPIVTLPRPLAAVS